MKWAKMASDLDSNPKAVMAGRLGREVFLFFLRRNAVTESNGTVTAPSRYAAHLLQMPIEEFDQGVADAREAGLIDVLDGDQYRIVGWDDSWRGVMTDAERSRNYRARKKKSNGTVTDSHASVTERHGRHALEERREEKKRERGGAGAPPAPDDTLATAQPGPDPTEDPPGLRSLTATKRQILLRHLATCLRLWARQDELRGPLKPTAARLLRVAQRLEGGATEAECLAVLEHYAAECKREPSQARWFNGETNWRPDNFDRALGMATTSGARRKPDKWGRR